MVRRSLYLLCAAALFAADAAAPAVEPKAAGSGKAVERGYKALTETAFVPPMWTAGTYDKLWQVWGEKAKPVDDAAAVSRRYGVASQSL